MNSPPNQTDTNQENEESVTVWRSIMFSVFQNCLGYSNMTYTGNYTLTWYWLHGTKINYFLKSTLFIYLLRTLNISSQINLSASAGRCDAVYCRTNANSLFFNKNSSRSYISAVHICYCLHFIKINMLQYQTLFCTDPHPELIIALILFTAYSDTVMVKWPWAQSERSRKYCHEWRPWHLSHLLTDETAHRER